VFVNDEGAPVLAHEESNKRAQQQAKKAIRFFIIFYWIVNHSFSDTKVRSFFFRNFVYPFFSEISRDYLLFFTNIGYTLRLFRNINKKGANRKQCHPVSRAVSIC
jgi:hypothetical protein